MTQGFTIAFREGLESFLVVALTLATLRKTGRPALSRAVWAGLAASLVVCAGAAALLQRARNQPLWEGLLALTAALLVSSLLVVTLRAAKTLKSDLERRVQEAAQGFWGGFGGVFLFTVLMVTREGMEAALLLSTAVFQIGSAAVTAGLLLGLLMAGAVGAAWLRLGRRVNVGVLLNISAAFLAVFLLQLTLAAVHELAEANVLPNARAVHDATEILGPDGQIGHAVTYLLALIPTAWLLVAWSRARWEARRVRTAPLT